MSTFRFTTLAVLALSAATATGVAQARDAEVRWSVTIGTPYYALPAPVYVQPQPVYVQPQPVYVQPQPVYVAPGPVYYYEPAPVYRRPVPVYRGAWRHPAPTYWDRDGDGIPNRYDALYNPRWDRDGDGVPDRWDRHPRDGGRR